MVPMRCRDVLRGIKKFRCVTEMCRDESRCAEGVQWIYRDVSISEDYGSGSDGDGDRRCRSVVRLYSSIRNMNLRDDV